MKKITLLSIMLFLIAQFTYSQDKHKRIAISNPTLTVQELISSKGIDLSCGVNHDHGKLILELSEFDLKILDDNNINYNIEIEDLSKFYGERAAKTRDEAIKNLKAEKLKAKSKKSSILSKSIASTALDNYLEYLGSDEIDWATPTNFNPGSMGGCLTVSEMEAELDDMRTLYPSLISAKADASTTGITTWGNPSGTISNNGNPSYTGQGTTRWDPQTIWYVRITGNQANPEGTNPQSLYTSMIHAREVGSIMSNIYFMWYLLENYATNPAIQNLVDNNELYFIPAVNPDGLRWNEHIDDNTAGDGLGMQRKNLRPNTGGTGNTSSNRGVDLNRNFDYFWGTAGSGSSPMESSNSYRGPSPFSEPETQILKEFVESRDLKTCLMNHTSANSIPHPYGGIPGNTSNREDEMHKWHEDMTRFNRYVSGATIFSAANGIADDWMVGGSVDGNGETGSTKTVLATTPEHGGTGFWPPQTDIVPIAKRAMRISLMTAYYAGKYAKLHDLTQSDVNALSSNLTFGIERLGQTASNFTITVTPVSSNISSIGSAVTETGMTILEQREVDIALTLNPAITANEKIEYNVQLSDGTNVFYNVNFEKYYQPTVLLTDNPDSDLLTNWTTSGTWTASNAAGAPYSGTRAIKLGANAISTYSNNNTSVLTSTSTYDFSSSTEVLIQFFSKWDIERNYDFVEIQGSTNGSTWQSLTGKYNKPSSTSSTNGHDLKGDSESFQDSNSSGIIYDGDRFDNWVMEEIAIDASNNSFLFGATNAQIRFRFRSDVNNQFENYSANGEGFFIDDFKIISVQIPCDNSNPPTSLAADVTTTALSAIMSWDAIPSATYDLRYREIGSPTWTEVTDIATNTYTINSLTDGTDYEAQIATRCTSTTSSYSASANFTATACTGTSINTFPYTEDWDNGIGDWSQGIDDVPGTNYEDWTLNSGTTISTGTGPNDDFTGGQEYFYTEASNANTTTNVGQGVSITLISPCFDLTGYENASFSFYYHMFGTVAGMGSLDLEVSTDNGSNWTNLETISGQQQGSNGAAWLQHTESLSAYDGQVIKLRFVGNTGTTFESDIAIDEIGLTADVVTFTTWYQDNDSDTFGNPSVSQVAASQPVGYVANNTDCDDSNDTINPNTVWYLGVDADGDTFFGSQLTATQCTSPGAGYTTAAPTVDDCDDSNDTINPNTVWYLGVDADGDTFFGSQLTATQCTSPGAGYTTAAPTVDDCDDSNDTINPNTVWYLGVDADGDTFFGSQLTATQCTSPGAGYTTAAPTVDDCDDSNDTINPNTVWYLGVDADGDTFFGSQLTATQCTSPGAGYTTAAPTVDDCDDSNDTINPNTVWYLGVDADGDTFFGSQLTATQCTSPGAGYTTAAPTVDDCDDSNDTINPNTVWYLGVDADGDTFFGSQLTATQCTSPGAGYTTAAPTVDDCDDSNDTINPNTVWYLGVDADGDTFFGSQLTATQCTSPGAGYTTAAPTVDDCDDSNDTINPNTVWYLGVDADGDTFFGSQLTATQCTSPGAGYTTAAPTVDDCDDSNDTINPNTVWYLGVDADGDTFFGSQLTATQCTSPGAGYTTAAPTVDDCDDSNDTINPNTVWYLGVDADGDTFFGSQLTATQCTSPGAGYTTAAPTVDDCDDSNDTINPNTVWYLGVDADGDTFFGSQLTATQCTSPGAGYTTAAPTIDDCDDSDDTINPNTVWYLGVDADGDTFFGSQLTATQCTSPGAGYTTAAPTVDDCDDSNDTINPNTVWYLGVDADGDTFFGSQLTATQCTSPGAGYTTAAPTVDDCDDSNDTINPNTVWYLGVDADGDTFFGSQLTATQCTSPGAGYTTATPTVDDCDDSNNTINPNTVWYLGVDADGDTFFGSQLTATQCTSPGAGYTTAAPTVDDCDDSNDTINPNTVWYLGVDADGDTFFGSQLTATQCTSPGAGYTTAAPTIDDCDDSDDTINPNTVWYLGVDADGDTFFGSQLTATQCTSPGAGYTTAAPTVDDCDDSNDIINPNTVWYLGVDADGDTFFGSQLTATQCTSPGAGYTTAAPTIDDCDDSDDTIYLGAPEILNDGIDQDCNGSDQTTLDINEFNIENVLITPNPFRNTINVKLPIGYNNNEFDIKIFDLNGRLVFNSQYFSINSSIKVSGLDKLEQAPYLFKIINKETGVSILKRLIKY